MSWVAVGTGVGTAVGAYFSSKNGGGGERSRSRSRSASRRFAPAIRDQATDLSNEAESIFDNVEFVGPTNEQRAALREQEDLAQRLLPSARRQTPGQTLETADKTLTSTLEGDFLTPESNPALQANIDAATGQITDEFQRNVLPEIGSAAQKAGAFGGARQGLAEARAADEVTENVGETASKMIGENFARERQLQQQALQFAPQFSQAEQSFAQAPATILGDVGSQRRKFARQEERFPVSLAKEEANFLNTLSPGPSSSSRTVRRRPGAPRTVRVMRGATGGAQLGNSLATAFTSGNPGNSTAGSGFVSTQGVGNQVGRGS